MPDPTGDPKTHADSEFTNGMSGSCLCGSITVTIKDNELFSKRRGHLCHCANCRKVAGSYVASNLLIETDKVEIEDRDGTKKVYEDRHTLSGNPVYRSFCSKDGKYVGTCIVPQSPTSADLTKPDQFRDRIVPGQDCVEDGHIPTNSPTGGGRVWTA